MDQPRRYSASVMLESDTMWVMGGEGNSDDDGSKHTTEFINQKGPGPLLPVPMTFHCAARVNASHVFIGGNLILEDEPELARQAYLVETKSMTFHRLPDMKQPKFAAGCGVLDFLKNGRLQRY